jgi:hypothetical protein
MNADELRAKIRDIKDFPTEGILFKDITTLLKDGPAFRSVIDALAKRYTSPGVDVVVGVESRGFIFAGALAHQLGAGFVPVRKLGKLPAKTVQVDYELEYGRSALAIHEDAIEKGQRVRWPSSRAGRSSARIPSTRCSSTSRRRCKMGPVFRLTLATSALIVIASVAPVAADEAKTPLSASMILDIVSSPVAARKSAYDAGLKEPGVAMPPDRTTGEVLPDGSVRYGRTVITVKNPCPPGEHLEPIVLPGRRNR